jgi:hypothetical protein
MPYPVGEYKGNIFGTFSGQFLTISRSTEPSVFLISPVIASRYNRLFLYTSAFKSGKEVIFETTNGPFIRLRISGRDDGALKVNGLSGAA